MNGAAVRSRGSSVADPGAQPAPLALAREPRGAQDAVRAVRRADAAVLGYCLGTERLVEPKYGEKELEGLPRICALLRETVSVSKSVNRNGVRRETIR